jgi:hypothetical protein
MKIISSLSLFVIILSQSCFAQINTQDNKLRIVEEYYPGVITKKDGSTIEGYILSTFGASQYSSIQFRTDVNDLDTQRGYRPKDLISFELKNLKYNSFQYATDSVNINCFARILEEGCVNLYKYMDVNDDGKEINKFILSLDGKITPLVQSGARDKKLLEVTLTNNQAAKTRIDSLKEEYSTADIENIITDYNQACK